MEKKILPYIVVASALSVSISAAFYSVTGIGKMFSGSSTNVMIMMASLEIAKLVLASLLYQYWGKLNLMLKAYYFAAIFTLMIITSAGIYGYLSAAYSETSNKVENIDKQVGVLNLKRTMFESQLNDIRLEKDRISNNISDLTKGLSNNYQQYKDKSGNILSTTSSSNRKAFESQLKNAQNRRDELSLKETALSDSISKIDLAKLDLETNAGVAHEIGPLKYIAKVTGKSVDVVVNWFIIALMLVFDPLAVSLVVGANVIFRDKNKEKEKANLSNEIDKKIEDFKKLEDDFLAKSKEFEDRESLVKQKELDFEIKSAEIEKTLKDKELSLEKLTLDKEKELQEKENNLDIQFDQKQKELYQKEESLIKEYADREKLLESNISQREELLESRVSEKEKELESQTLELKLKIEGLEVEEDKLKSKIKSEEERIQKLENSLLEDKDNLKIEKKNLSVQKKIISDERKKLEEDRKELKLEWSKLDDSKQELMETQKVLDNAKEELLRIENEIKEWENQHWKMKRNPPPSAIY